MLNNEASNTKQIVLQAEKKIGTTFQGMQFHSYDAHQQPLPEILNAEQYATWLFDTNKQRSQQELRELSEKYSNALSVQRTAIGITPNQLAHLAIAAEVFQSLSTATPVLPTIPTAATETTTTPVHMQANPLVEQKKKVAPKSATPYLPESTHDLESLCAQLRAELHIADGVPLSAAMLKETIEKQMEEKTNELRLQVEQNTLSESERDNRLQIERRELERRAIELQSVGARLKQSTTASVPPTMLAITPADHRDAITQLKKQEQEVLASMSHIEQLMETIGLPPQELTHIRHQLHAVEELMKDIEEETNKN